MIEDVLAVSVVIGAVLTMIACGFYASWRATRLHRLHRRVDLSRAGLRAALERRRAITADLARELGPTAGAELGAAVTAADGEEPTESELSRELRRTLATAALRTGDITALLPDVASAAKGVHLARVFHNAAVADTRRARRSRVVRLLRLAGGAPLPDFYEIDDRPPDIPVPVPSPDTM
ncbi:hypothetical protein [Nocardiopsis lambiniae]|uniref:NUDIX hydrolase n=1 Tax=Nocardiopsis lambiniae TaxID=3075539 RepID=A0ABU2M3T3_9ACTN|nr:hypothetical protein [Nocardiopsis sp. DSM 44743]MDT0327308.1 hypothetical protein [Nocardiopsis sp. DSM 44743]